MTDVAWTTLEADAIAANVETFLRRELPGSWIDAIDREDSEALAVARADLELADWWIRLADAGLVAPTWPTRYGGLDLTPSQGNTVTRMLNHYKVPRFTNPVGVGQVGSALLRWGTETQRERFLRPIARHEEIWCQLFSEPGAGSDLACVSTRAIRDGERWVVRGQKVWTSMADRASFGLLVARTNPDVPKHRGITVFLLPMHQPGVTVRPLRDMTGDAPFNEVYLDDAVVDDSLRVGDIDEGWRIAISTVTGERQGLSGAGAALPGTVGGRSVESLIRRHTPIADPALRQRLAQLYIEHRILQMNNQRAAAGRRAGRGPGSAGSVGKLFHSEHTQRLQNLACDLSGPASQAWDDSDRWARGTAWSFSWVRSRTIAGGTSEIQRNVIAERVLGLPKDASMDRDIPWSEVPRS